MANYKVTDSELSGIASAIRLKGGTSDPLVFPSGFISAISAIETQGTYVSKVITENGEYDPANDNADAFSHVTVSVPTGSGWDNNTGFDVVMEGKTGSVYNSTVSSVRDSICKGNNGITALSLPECLTIGSSAFMSCSSLLSVNLSKATLICDQAFYNCQSLQNIEMPECISIYGYAFASCKKLSSIELPKCIEVSKYAFQSCADLQEIYFYDNVKFQSAVFNNCIKLECVYLLSASVCVLISTATFWLCPIFESSYLGRYGSIYVPSNLVDSYKTANVWSNISDRITAYVEE